MTYYPREIVPLISRALRSLPVVVVTGLRQAGKTTLLVRDPAFRGRRYLSLDEFATLETAQRDPEALLEGKDPITIDEAQKCPELLRAVKRVVDRRRERGRFLLSGSANFALLRDITESLAGRALYLTLHPFTRREAKAALGRPPFLLEFMKSPSLPARRTVDAVREEEILNGGLPPIAIEESVDRDLWLMGYEQTYLERDIRELSQVADLISFRNAVRLTALRTGQILNQSELARDAKLPVTTLARYLGLLETSFVVSRLLPFLGSRAARLIKSPKIFVSDSGLGCYLTSVSKLDATADEPLRGALFETYVHQNLAALLGAHLPQAELGFWSVQGRNEVDFVITHEKRSFAIEVKAATRFAERDVSGLKAFGRTTPHVASCILAYNGVEPAQLGEHLYALPLGLLLS